MTGSAPAILSVSRRTDIPAFYMDWFMAGLARGFFEVVNPYNRRLRRIPAGPHEVHSIVLWSKDFGPFLDGACDRQLARRGYRLFFNFTLNSPSAVLEPHIPPLQKRLDQMAALARRYDPRLITWRFDPVCCFRRRGETALSDNLDQLEIIADTLAGLGIQRCVTSFVDCYRKVAKRLPAAGLEFVEPSLPAKRRILMRMAASLRERNITLGACCEKAVLTGLPPEAGIRSGECIPGPLLAEFYGGGMVLKSDPGQRRTQGCTCNLSTDIGAYDRHPCFHNCLFCYANPQAPPRPQMPQGKA